MKRSLILGGVLGAALFAAGGTAQAQSIIRNNDSHPHFEIDVHGTLHWGWGGGWGWYGAGGGVRLGIPIVPSGFLSRANDSFALSVGADLVWFPAYWGWYGGVVGHVDGQWNFFLTERWSVFAELGFAPMFFFGVNAGYCNGAGCYFTPWFDAAVGARFHFRGGAQFPTLTMRAGSTGFNIGVSF